MLKINTGNNKGFTLVEVIVVAVIVAILAAVAIPLYIGYINDAAQNQANNLAVDLSSAASAAINQGFSTSATAAVIVLPTATTSGTITWPLAAFTPNLTNDIVFRMPKGMTADAALTAANLKVIGTACVLTIKGKSATANW